MTLSAHQLACVCGDRQLFSTLNFEVGAGTALRVGGINGSGKTSLLRILVGMAVPEQGEVRWNGRNIRTLREEFSRKLLYLGHSIGVKDDLLAWENVVFTCLLSGIRIGRDQAFDALASLDLDEAADLPARSLSQGQRKRLSLARLQFAAGVPLWILDEPFTALDGNAVTSLCAVLDRHLADGGMLVYVTHQELALAGQRNLHLDVSRATPC